MPLKLLRQLFEALRDRSFGVHEALGDSFLHRRDQGRVLEYADVEVEDLGWVREPSSSSVLFLSSVRSSRAAPMAVHRRSTSASTASASILSFRYVTFDGIEDLSPADHHA